MLRGNFEGSGNGAFPEAVPSKNGAETSQNGVGRVTVRICEVDGCDTPLIAKGLCSKHYDRMRRHGSTEIPARPTICTVDGCDHKVRAKGLCNKHYKRMCRYGSTDPRPRNETCTVEDCEQPHLAKGLCRFHYDQARRSKNGAPTG